MGWVLAPGLVAGFGSVDDLLGNTSTPSRFGSSPGSLPDGCPAGVDVPVSGSTVGNIEPYGLAGLRFLPSHFESLGDFGAATIGLAGIEIAKAAIKAMICLRIICSSICSATDRT